MATTELEKTFTRARRFADDGPAITPRQKKTQASTKRKARKKVQPPEPTVRQRRQKAVMQQRRGY
jgi:hypothetical protein